MFLKELREKIKPLGFKIKTKGLSWGRHLTYVHVESGEELTFNILTEEQAKRWKPLYDYLKTIPENEILQAKYGERIFGTMFRGDSE